MNQHRPKWPYKEGAVAVSVVADALFLLLLVVVVVVVVVLVVVVVVVVVGAPPHLPSMLVDIFTSRALGGRGGGGVIIAYKPSSANQLPPNLMPSFNCAD